LIKKFLDFSKRVTLLIPLCHIKSELFQFTFLPIIWLVIFLPNSATGKNSMPKFESSISPIPAKTQKIMEKYTWRPGCPVPLRDLAEVKLSYWGFDQKVHQGILIVNKSLATEVVSIFKAAYYHQFPIERMETMVTFKGNDDAAMAVNNTSAFNCRAVTGKPGVFSQHSYGRAIDINTLINPYVKANLVLPPGGKKYVDRKKFFPGKITNGSFIYNEFIKRGWDWGGNWHNLQDYQHFEKKICEQ
jgi:hypothetical protein